MRYLILTLCFMVVCASTLLAQSQDVAVRFMPQWKKKTLTIGNWNVCESGDSVQLDLLRCYVGTINLMYKGKIVWVDSLPYHLLDASSNEGLLIKLRIPAHLAYNAIRFSIGVDSITNTAGVQGGDLDPMKGMYWAWQSGYINVKMEGHCSASSDVKKEFQFHLGGFLPPDASIQFLEIPIKASASLDVMMQMDSFFKVIDWGRQSRVMSPGIDAVQLSKRFAETVHSISQ